MLTPLLIAAVIGYFLGSLPFGFLVARAKGVNIFEVGSRSPGATNVRRVLGKGPGNLVFALDAAKGAAAASWALLARTDTVIAGDFDSGFSWANFSIAGENWISAGIAGLVGALVGHSFSCFTKFRGGKGVATASGGMLVLMPVALLLAAAVWALVFYSAGYVSLASIVSVIVLPLAAWLLHLPRVLVGLAGLIALFVIVRHRANIRRLLDGTENKFVKKSRRPGGEPKP